MVDLFILNVSIILISGFVAGCVCKYFKISPLIGYLLIGALIGPGGLDLTLSKELKKENAGEAKITRLAEEHEAADKNRQNAALSPTESGAVSLNPADALNEREAVELAEEEELQGANVPASETEIIVSDPNASIQESIKEQEKLEKRIDDAHASAEAVNLLTEFGCLLLLFAIGIEFTFDKLTATAKYMFVGGTLQMGVTIAVTMLICHFFGMTWVAGLAIGSVVALSSTALVYRSMTDMGQADTKRAQATLGLLIFQDLALVPLLLVLPRVLGAESGGDVALWVENPWVDMALKSVAFCAIVLVLKFANVNYTIPRLAKLQSNDMVILYAILVLVGMCLVAKLLGLTPALGALAAGVALGENRLTHQIDALVMPFRETFSAMFFISLGMMTDFAYVFEHPVVCLVTLAGAILSKALCATGALKACGMDFRGALAFGTSISQIGELAFMILALAYSAHAIKESTYNTMLFVSVASLVVTPYMVKLALTKFGMKPEELTPTNSDEAIAPELRERIKKSAGHVVIVGAGHIGKRVADEIVSLGGSVCLVDFNPVNLHPFEQNGIATVVGDGADQKNLRAAGIDHADAVFVTVPRDDLSLNVVRSARDMNPTLQIVARARYSLNVSLLKRAGANRVFCEEERIADELVDILKRYAEESKRLAASAGA